MEPSGYTYAVDAFSFRVFKRAHFKSLFLYKCKSYRACKTNTKRWRQNFVKFDLSTLLIILIVAIISHSYRVYNTTFHFMSINTLDLFLHQRRNFATLLIHSSFQRPSNNFLFRDYVNHRSPTSQAIPILPR